jgi:hypothetical protein
MKAALRDYYVLWRMALSARNAYANAFLLSVTALAALAIGLLVWLKTSDAGLVLGVAARIVLGGLLTGYVMYFLPGAAKLNTPVHARLVPRMRRRLMQLTAASWAGATGLAALLAWGTPLSPAFVLLGMGTWLATLGLARSGHRAGTVAQFMFFPAFMVPGAVDLARQHLAHGAGFAIAVALMLALAAFTLKTMFMNGGDRHFALCTEQKLQTERLTQQGQFKERNPNRFAMNIYLATLRRDSAGHNAGKLLAHLLGAREHWTQQVLVLGSAALLAGIAVFVLRQVGGETVRRMLTDNAPMYASGIFIASLFEFGGRNTRLIETRGEQALLRLAPVMPARAPVFNRSLARLLLRNAATNWCMLLAASLWVTLAAGAPPSGLLKQVCLACLTLPLIGLNLRDQARLSSMLGSSVLLFLLTSAGVSIVAGIILRAATGLPVLPGAALMSIMIACVDGARRWKASVDAPHAFPVGRLAS